MEYNITYPFKIWLTGAIIGSTVLYSSLLLFHSASNQGDRIGDSIVFYMVVLLISLFGSLPAFLILWLSTHLLCKTRFSSQLIRLLLSILCIVLCTLSFAILPQFDINLGDFSLVLFYSIPLIASIYYFKFND